MQIIEIPYGNSTVKAEIPDSQSMEIVVSPEHKAEKPVEELIEEALDHPIASPKMEEIIPEQGQIVIIVNDHTRPGPNRQLCEALIRRLKKAGTADERISFVVATGSHRPSTEAELISILGEDLYHRFPVILHDCKKDCVKVGRTSAGLDIWINRRVAEAALVITTGLITPHHSAGFSGGRKSIVPGVSGIETLRRHHSLEFRPFDTAIGYFEGNPFHVAALEGARMINARFMINVVQDAHKNNMAVVAGDLEKAHEAGVALCRKYNTIPVKHLADVVVVSPGGAPRDADLYQAQKGLALGEVFAAKEGCTFILCAKGNKGIGEGLFRDWMVKADTPEQIIEWYRQEGFNVGNNKAFMYARALTKGKIIIVSDCLNPDDLHAMMLDHAYTLQDAVDRVLADHPKHIIVVPNAVNMIPEIENSKSI